MKASKVAFFGIFIACRSAILHQPQTPLLTEQPRAILNEIMENLGAVRPDGTLLLQYDLTATSDKLRQLGLALGIRHELSQDPQGRPISTWEILGRTSFLVVSADELSWKNPMGKEIRQALSSVGYMYTRFGKSQYFIRKIGPQSYEVRSGAGVIWHFENGLATGIWSPELGRCQVVSQAGLVERITQLDTGESLLEFSTDTHGSPLAISGSGLSGIYFRWDSSRQLVGLEIGKEAYGFNYTNGLINAIVRDGEVKRIVWKLNPAWRRKDLEIAKAATLAELGQDRFAMQFDRQSYRIDRLAAETNSKYHFIWEPRLHRLLYVDSDKTFTVVYKKYHDRELVSHILGGDRNVVETYAYDSDGLLIRRSGDRGTWRALRTGDGRLIGYQFEPPAPKK